MIIPVTQSNKAAKARTALQPRNNQRTFNTESSLRQKIVTSDCLTRQSPEAYLGGPEMYPYPLFTGF